MMLSIFSCTYWSLVYLERNVYSFAHFIHLFIYLFIIAALGLRSCTWAFSSCRERGLLFIVVRGRLIVVASVVAERGL